ncbi:MAG: UDP-3-O-(3-hydroxymyristoyl)glucosamine N-acyltransferase [Hyphomonadaceae bacterium]
MIDPRFYDLLGPARVGDLAAVAGAQLAHGDPNKLISAVASLSAATPDELTFQETTQSEFPTGLLAGACIVRPETVVPGDGETCILLAANPRSAFAKIAQVLVRPKAIAGHDKLVHPTATLADDVLLQPGCVIAEGVSIGQGTSIGANAVIGPGVQIGRNTRIGPGAVVQFALVGDNVTILAGAVVGETGFGLTIGSGGAVLTPHLGRVILQDGCSLGANSTVDRGLFDDTVIGTNTHIDNLSHVGHNTVIGSNTVMAAFAGISGSCKIGSGAQFGGRTGVADHIEIGDEARLAAGSAVMRDVPAGETHGGYPAKLARTWMRELAWLSQAAQKRPK